jgi:hypothetical protein
VPVIAVGAFARGYDLFWLKGELPAGGSFAEGVLEVGRESRADALGESLACGEHSFPGEYEGRLVADDHAEVFDDEASDHLRMPRGELIGVDAAERVAEKNCVVQVQVIEEGFEVEEVVGAGVARGVVRVSMTSLVECDDSPLACEEFGERREGGRLHDVRMESDEWAAAASGVEIGEPQAIAGEGATFHAGHDIKLSTFYRILNHAWYGQWKTGVVRLARRWEN